MLRVISSSRLQFHRIVGLVACNERLFSTEIPTSLTSTSSPPLIPATEIILRSNSLAAPFRCVQNDPTCHALNHEGQFYQMPVDDYKQLFTFGGVMRDQQRKMKSFNECCVMVRRPAIEVINYIQQANYSHPVNRYILHGVVGSGKTMSLVHLIHVCYKLNWLIVHVPWLPLYIRIKSEIVPSTYNENRVDLPVHAVTWLQHFKLQNSELLQNIQPKIRNTYTWSKREVTEEGSPLTDIIDHGINRVKFSSDCVGAILKEIKILANEGVFRVLVAIDAVNGLFGSTRHKRADLSTVMPDDVSLLWHFKKLLKADWKNGAIVTTVDTLGAHSDHRESHLPFYLLKTKGFELFDPFIPISVELYTMKEINSCLDYYIDRHWIQSEKGKTNEGRDQLIFLSGRNPKNLSEICGPY